MDSAYEKIPLVKTPVLLLYGAKDQVIPAHPIGHAVQRFTIPIEYAYYPHGFHMLLRDLESEIVMKDILSWIKNSNAPLPSGFGKKKKPSSSQPKA
jgi:alpha-beta hydrolase superfamily lysophospholipase